MKQITVITPNRPGLMADISGALASAGINIENLDAETFADRAVIILSVDRYDAAMQLLQTMPEVKAVSEDAILLRLRNMPGALAQISKRFKDANINIRSMRFIEKNDEFALVAISADRTQEALRLVKDVLVA